MVIPCMTCGSTSHIKSIQVEGIIGMEEDIAADAPVETAGQNQSHSLFQSVRVAST